ncbi:MAG: hypothetical protein ACT4SY_01595 [Hyphomicrobiales bacterium]
MKALLAAIAAAAFMTAGAAANAGEIADAAGSAERLLEQGKYDEAMKALDTVQDMIWREAPLSIRKAVFVSSDPQGFGIYTERPNNEFARNESLIIYAEPFGFGYGRDGDLFVIDLGLDFTIKDKDGSVLAQQENFGSLTLRSRVPNREFMAKLNYDFSGLEPGDYEVLTRMKDKNSDKAVEFSMPFKIKP